MPASKESELDARHARTYLRKAAWPLHMPIGKAIRAFAGLQPGLAQQRPWFRGVLGPFQPHWPNGLHDKLGVGS